jgi:hypothetical protein
MINKRRNADGRLVLDGGEKIIKPGVSGMAFSILGVLWSVKSAFRGTNGGGVGPNSPPTGYKHRPPTTLAAAGRREESRQGLL